MAFKTFAPGVLTSSDVNTFLMQQAVITCTSSTRPASPVEGMTIYETNTDALAIYDGSNWIYRGYWQAYTPTFTGLTLGNGEADFEYAQVGRIVFVRGSIVWGSTTTITAVNPDTITYTLPLTTDTSGSKPTPAASINMGAAIDDSTATRVPIRTGVATTTTASLAWFGVSGVVVTENAFNTTNAPFAFAVDDSIYINLVYEAA